MERKQKERCAGTGEGQGLQAIQGCRKPHMYLIGITLGALQVS